MISPGLEIKKCTKGFGGLLVKKYLPLYPGLKNIKVILLYHRVLKEPPRKLYDPSLFVTASTFEMHINELSRMFEIVPLEDLTHARNERGRLCAITFDDGWIDNYEVAFPIIKKWGVPATIFISTKRVSSDGSFWFESLWDLANQATENRKTQIFINYFHKLIPTWDSKTTGERELALLTNALKSLPGNTLDDIIAHAYRKSGTTPTAKRTVIDWENAYEMSKSGISFGSHGLHHYILNGLDSSSKRMEVIESFEDLKKRPVSICPFFSYPNGSWDEESLTFVRQAGYQGALTTRLGHNNLENSPFLLNRIGLHEYISRTPALFWFRIFQGVLAGSGPQGE